MRRSLVLMALVALVSFPSWGVDAKSDRIALVIGNSAYDGSVPALVNPGNDAQDIARHLRDNGWKVIEAENASRRDMSRRLAEFRDQLKGAEKPTALFFYAGHGIQIDGRNYLLPVGEEFETSDDVKDSALIVDRVTDVFSEAKVLQSLIILDACRDNPFAKKSRSLGGSRGLNVVSVSEFADEGSAVIFSTAPNDTAADGEGRNGVFTASLLKFIDGPQDLPALFKTVRDDVRKSTAGKQTPSIVVSGTLGAFYLGTPMDLAATSVAGDPNAMAISLKLAELQGIRSGLGTRLVALKPQQTLWSSASLLSWVGAGVGTLTASGALVIGLQARSDYDAARTAGAATSARDRAIQADLVWQAGVLSAAGFAVTALLANLLTPDLVPLEREIQGIDSQMTTLGGAQ